MAKSTGRRCTRPAIPGGKVCRHHGGAAPQVKAKADERLKAMIFPALARIQALIGDPERGRVGAESEAVALAASFGILDRTGYSAKHRVEMSGDLTMRSPVDMELEELAEKIRDAGHVSPPGD